MENSYAIDGKDIDKKRILEALRMENFKPNAKEKKWAALLKKIPLELKSVLLSELLLGNSIESIQNSNWPQQGSIVVCLNQHFKKDVAKNCDLLKYKILNDPHYWYDEVTQIKDEIEYLIISQFQ